MESIEKNTVAGNEDVCPNMEISDESQASDTEGPIEVYRFLKGLNGTLPPIDEIRADFQRALWKSKESPKASKENRTVAVHKGPHKKRQSTLANAINKMMDKSLQTRLKIENLFLHQDTDRAPQNCLYFQDPNESFEQHDFQAEFYSCVWEDDETSSQLTVTHSAQSVEQETGTDPEDIAALTSHQNSFASDDYVKNADSFDRFQVVLKNFFKEVDKSQASDARSEMENPDDPVDLTTKRSGENRPYFKALQDALQSSEECVADIETSARNGKEQAGPRMRTSPTIHRAQSPRQEVGSHTEDTAASPMSHSQTEEPKPRTRRRTARRAFRSPIRRDFSANMRKKYNTRLNPVPQRSPPHTTSPN